MKQYPIVIIAIAMVSIGCSKKTASVSGSGNITPVLRQLLLQHGAKLPSGTATSPVKATWTYTPDEYGFVLNVTGDTFSQVDKLLRSYFGKPYSWEEKNVNGMPNGVFSVMQTGGPAIQYIQTESRGVQIICLLTQNAQQDGASPGGAGH